MKIERMTRQMLREMVPGKTVIYELPTAKQCESARAMCGYLKAYEGIAFTTAIQPANKTIAITRLRSEQGVATAGEG